MAEAGEDAAREARESEPGIDELVRELGATGSATVQAGREAGKALRIMVAADVSLARSAFGRSIAFSGAAIALGASAWLLLMAALVLWLNRGAGLAWSLSLLVPALLSLIGAALAGWMATRYFEHTRMKATRRQLARLGFGELAGLIPDAGSGESAASSADSPEPAKAKTRSRRALAST